MSAHAPTVLHCDNHLLVLLKPAGMPTQPDASGDLSLLDWAQAWVKAEYGKVGQAYIGLVQRLDRPVAGVIALARTSKAAARLSEALRAGTMRKTYLCRCEAAPAAADGRWEDWLLPAEAGAATRVVAPGTPGAKVAALTFALVSDDGEDGVRGSVELHTGRKHQIRAQLSARRAPIAGDGRYGARDRRWPRIGAEIALQASSLTLPHPIGGAPLTFEAPTPWWWMPRATWPAAGLAAAADRPHAPPDGTPRQGPTPRLPQPAIATPRAASYAGQEAPPQPRRREPT